MQEFVMLGRVTDLYFTHSFFFIFSKRREWAMQMPHWSPQGQKTSPAKVYWRQHRSRTSSSLCSAGTLCSTGSPTRYDLVAKKAKGSDIPLIRYYAPRVAYLVHARLRGEGGLIVTGEAYLIYSKTLVGSST